MLNELPAKILNLRNKLRHSFDGLFAKSKKSDSPDSCSQHHKLPIFKFVETAYFPGTKSAGLNIRLKFVNIRLTFLGKIFTYMRDSINIFGTELTTCSTDPMTGYYRNGCCDTDDEDFGRHTICAIMTDEFLEFSKKMGNDLTTPQPQWGFPGLVAGDRWCVCLSRWLEALDVGEAPLIVPEACHESVLEMVDMKILLQYAQKKGGHP